MLPDGWPRVSPLSLGTGPVVLAPRLSRGGRGSRHIRLLTLGNQGGSL